MVRSAVLRMIIRKELFSIMSYPFMSWNYLPQSILFVKRKIQLLAVSYQLSAVKLGRSGGWPEGNF